MALQIEWTPDAKAHLSEILEYWIERNGTSTYSQKLYESVKNVLTVLSKYPESGHATERQGIRSKIIKDYFIFYTFDNKILSVIGFCDMRRSPDLISTLID